MAKKWASPRISRKNMVFIGSKEPPKKGFYPGGRQTGVTVRGLNDRATMLAHSTHVRRHEILTSVRGGKSACVIARHIGVPVSVVTADLKAILDKPMATKADKTKIRGLLGK